MLSYKDKVIVKYKDGATSFNGLKKGFICGKGIINKRITNIIFKYLEKNGIETYMIEELSSILTLVKDKFELFINSMKYKSVKAFS